MYLGSYPWTVKSGTESKIRHSEGNLHDEGYVEATTDRPGTYLHTPDIP